MTAVIINKEVVTRMTKTTWGRDRVKKLLANAWRRWFVDYIHLLWTVKALEKNLGSDDIEDFLVKTKRKLRRLERLLGLDKKEVVEPDWEPYWDYEWEEPEPPII